MSVEAGGTAQTAEHAAARSPATPTPGELLRAGREGRGLSVQQVADELHLDVRSVQAIESNKFLLLGAPVYARGHLRKYAALLGLAPDVVIAHYETLTDVPPAPTAIPASVVDPLPQRASLRKPALITAGLLAAGALLWIATVLVDRFSPSLSPAIPAQSPTATSAPSVERIADRLPTAEPLAPSPDVPLGVAPPPLETPAPGNSAALSTGDVQLRLVFSDPSWVEIYDASERRLMYDVGQTGQTRVIAGKAPLRVTLGLASAVSLDVNDKRVVVPRRSGRDATRFTVAADGSLR